VSGRLLRAIAASALTLCATGAGAQLGPAVDVRQPIEIEAKTLDVQQDRRTAIFAGDVVATQGAMMLRADRVQVAYAATGGPNAITRIDASGKVIVATPVETAQGNAAAYDVGTGIITLTGAVVLTRGENVLRGERLVLNLVNGTSRMEGGAAVGADGRVRGVFIPEGAATNSGPMDQDGPRLVASNDGLLATKLGKSYKKRPVLRDVSLSVQRGEAVGLLGPNGAGKTTCFYILSGLIAPDYGNIFLDGHEITNLPMYRRARLGIGYLPQEASIFRGLTVENNIRAVLELVEPMRDAREALLDELLAEFSISHLRRTPSQALSGGERRRVEIARALATRPSFMLLDEPLAGIDPIAVADIRDLVSHLKDRGIGALITDHNVREALDIVDRAYILHEGRLLMEGPPAEIVAHKDVRRVYLGERFSL
jgi:lipopolysaccharide export system ATP-binding protein